MKQGEDSPNSVLAEPRIVHCAACREKIFSVGDLVWPLSGDQFNATSDGWGSPPASTDRNDLLCPLCGWVFLTPAGGVMADGKEVIVWDNTPKVKVADFA